MKVITYFLGVVMLSGCAATYIEPSADDSARLRINVGPNRNNIPVNVNIYTSGQCENPNVLGYIGGALNQSDLTGRGMPSNQELQNNTYFERYIAPGKGQLLTIRILEGGYECWSTFSIDVEPKKDYEVLVTPACLSYLSTVELKEGKIIRNPVVSKQDKPICKKGFN